ncbi:MAG TPA: molybdenum cofactor biosynthesis protein B [Candidatus Binataceae bacterium]|nr:molybdenum cofactor biosynthesis protein B [Candidatus Binataceae bacterium]
MPVHEHHRYAGGHVHLKVAIITASDTRTPADDESGQIIRTAVEGAGHSVTFYAVIPDDPERIRAVAIEHLSREDLLIINGGTGIAARDSTIEAIRPLLNKELEGFGELFRMLSYQEIGAAAFLSRALAGTAHGRIVVVLPGSPAACRLAMEKLLIPELGHMAHLLKL